MELKKKLDKGAAKLLTHKETANKTAAASAVLTPTSSPAVRLTIIGDTFLSMT